MVDAIGYGGCAILAFLLLWTFVCIGMEVHDCMKTVRRRK